MVINMVNVNDIRKSMVTKSKITLNKETIFLIGFSFYLIQAFLKTTMFREVIPSFLFSFIKLVGISLVVFKIGVEKYTVKKILILFITFIIFFLSFWKSTYSILLEYAIFVIGAKGISFKKIANLYFKINFVLLMITIISSQIGIIEDLVYYRKDKDKYRHSFGAVYPTDFAAHVFFLSLAYVYKKDKKITWYQIVCILTSALLIYQFCDARLDAICIVLVAFISLCNKWNVIYFKNFFVKYGLIFSFLICGALSLFLTINYDNSNEFYIKTNELLSSRLRIGNMMYHEYGIKMFGQLVEDHGFGGSLTFEYEVYNYIDCSYLRILLKYGLVSSILITILNIVISQKLYKTQNYNILLLLLLVSINSMVAQHYIDFSYNFLLLIYLANLENEEEKNRLNDLEERTE